MTRNEALEHCGFEETDAQKIKRLTAELEECRNKLKCYETPVSNEPTPPHPTWEPKVGELYFYLCDTAIPLALIWSDSDDDIDRLVTGNVYASRYSAIADADYMETVTQMREWASADPFAPWGLKLIRRGASKYEIGVEKFCSYVSYGDLRFLTSDDAWNCISKVGALNILQNYFGLRDGELVNMNES